MKDTEIYNIFNTEKILNRSATVSISKTSGLAGIAYWLNQNYRLTGENQLTKQDPIVVYLKEWVDAQYEDGRQTFMSNKEIEDEVMAYVRSHEMKGLK